MTSLVLSAKQLAAELSVSQKTIRRMDAAGKLPRPIRLSPSCVRWPRATIESWLAECEREGRSIDRREWESLQAAAVNQKGGRR
jgi:predicted DNA-binding transcriptional regulator AlpA